VTWPFLFLAILLLGAVMAATSGLLRRITVHHLRHSVTMPAPEHHSAVVNLAMQRASIVVAAFGLAGLAGPRSDLAARLTIAVVAALVAALVVILALRPVCAPRSASRARVVRAIAPSGYGQIELDQGGRTLVLAARTEDGSEIPVGREVDVVDCESSVVTVRLSEPASRTR
jgi:hypothetical protein